MTAWAGSFLARSAAKRTQFLLAAFASYIAVSAQAISCCGDEACFGNAATPKLAVSESCNRRETPEPGRVVKSLKVEEVHNQGRMSGLYLQPSTVTTVNLPW